MSAREEEHVHDETCFEVQSIAVPEHMLDFVKREYRSIERQFRRWQIAAVLFRIIGSAFGGWTIARAIVENQPLGLLWLALVPVYFWIAHTWTRTAHQERESRGRSLVARIRIDALIEKMNEQIAEFTARSGGVVAEADAVANPEEKKS